MVLAGRIMTNVVKSRAFLRKMAIVATALGSGLAPTFSANAQQSGSDLRVLKGLAPMSALDHTPEGVAALAANFTVTGGIQTGVHSQATLLPYRSNSSKGSRTFSSRVKISRNSPTACVDIINS